MAHSDSTAVAMNGSTQNGDSNGTSQEKHISPRVKPVGELAAQGDTDRGEDTPPLQIKVPVPTLERLTTYLRCLIDFGTSGIDTISSAQIEDQTGISAAQFRKDLSYFGEFGKPGVGYNVRELENRIARILQIHKLQPILLMGAGNLGSALVGYPGLEEHKFKIVAVFDNDVHKVGKRLWGMEVQDAQRVYEVNEHIEARIAILAVPAHAAQAAADTVVDAGVRAILNFAPVVLKVPELVIVRNVSFLQELAVLSYRLRESQPALT
ncbi:MAG: redox-sensing transcriptional repressor Rex [Armatimonadaceae bacterium]